jgi:MutS domain V
MELTRSKELQKLISKTHVILQESPDKLQGVIESVCDAIPKFDATKTVSMGSAVMRDLDLDTWIEGFATTVGGKETIALMVASPIHDAEILNTRAHIATTMVTSHNLRALEKAAKNESAVLWVLSLPMESKDTFPFHILFPSWPIIRYLNYFPLFILALHIFRGYISPLLNVMYPLSGIFGPYFYMRRYLKFKMSIVQYLNILKLAATVMLRPGADLRRNATKYVSIIIYIALFLYGIIQGFDLAHIIRTVRADLITKMDRIHKFIQAAKDLKLDLDAFAPGISTEDIDLDNNLVSMYKLMTSATLREQLKALLQKVYVSDVVVGAHKISKLGNGWTRCNYRTDTRLWGMGHPLLGAQVRNPIALTKNVIITGPNAAGKTTYMKSVCANMVLAQSLGFVCAVRNEICPVHSISTSIRVHDTVGEASLFEAEVRRCAEIVKEAANVADSGKRAMYFLDEPMHSTPPTEGAATAMAIAAHLGSLPGIRIFMTTHYHQVTALETLHPELWINVSMEAVSDETNSNVFKFPYKIKKGPSFQCIALEILKERCLPDQVITNAIEMKNKICAGLLD